MNNSGIADLDLKTITILAGMPINKDIINPKNPDDMAARVRVTFRPLPQNYYESEVKKFREALINCLKSNGVQVIQWDEASTVDESYGFISKILGTTKVRRNIHAVIDVKRNNSKFRGLLSRFAEAIYSLLRNSERSVMDLVHI